MNRNASLPAENVVLVGAEFDVLERVHSPGLRLYDERCSGTEAKAILDLLARGFLVVDGNGRLVMTHFGEAVRSSVRAIPGLVRYRGKVQRVYTLELVSDRRAASRIA